MSNTNLPYVSLNIEMPLNDSEMKLKMMEIVKSMGMEIVEDSINDNSFKFSKQQKNEIKDSSLSLVNNITEDEELQVSFQFLKDNNNRLVDIKSLNGNTYNNEATIISFIRKCVPICKEIKILTHSPEYFDNLEKDIENEFLDKEKNNDENKNHLNEKEQDLISGTNIFIENNSSIIETLNKQANSYNEISKILSQENYSVGKDLSIFINKFKTQNENIEKICQKLPKQMKAIIKMRNICNREFTDYFNMGQEFEKNEKLANNCKICIEKFIFTKLYSLLYDLYKKRYEKENELYLAKKKIINEKYTIEQIMEYVEIQPKFRCLEEYELFNKSKMSLPYKSTIDYLNRIEYEQDPKSKFDTLIEAGLELRNTILGFHDWNTELKSMDDELPIFIYCFTQTNIKNAPAELHMVEDYIRYCSGEFDESKVVTNAMSSVAFIGKGWETDTKENDNDENNDNII